MAQLDRETVLETLNRPFTWDDEVTIDFTWHESTHGGIPYWAVVAVVDWALAGTEIRYMFCADTAPDMAPGLHVLGDSDDMYGFGFAFQIAYNTDGAMDFIETTARMLTRRTVPADETSPTRLPVDAVRPW